MKIRFSSLEATTPGKLADAEIHFEEGPLQGLKLIGFAVWERRGGGGRNVTFPARQYQVNGERRTYALLRSIGDATAQNKIRDLILEAYAEREEHQEQAREQEQAQEQVREQEQRTAQAAYDLQTAQAAKGITKAPETLDLDFGF